MAELEVGTVIGGVRVDGVAGRGGMGVVYRATQLALNRTVALKLITPALADDPEFHARFKRESEMAALIEHPHAIPIFHAGEEDGLLYVTMRFVEGCDLGELISQQGRLDPVDAGRVINQVAGALDAAHERGLVHRDVKPANILISDGAAMHAYLTDFGLTKPAVSVVNLTVAGMLLGTVNYIAPEQLTGGPIDGRIDIYALGCVLYQALTGQLPFPYDTDAEKMWAHVHDPAPQPSAFVPDLPRDLDAVVARAMAKQPEMRFASAGEFGAAAVAAAAGPGSAASELEAGNAAAAMATPDTVDGVGVGQPEAAWHPSFPPVQSPVRGSWPQPLGSGPGPDSLPPAGRWPESAAAELPTQFIGARPGPRRGRRRLVLAVVGVVVAVVVGVCAILISRSPDPSTVAAGEIVGAPIAVGPGPSDVEEGAGFLWTANLGSDTISKVDPATGTSQEIKVGGRPSDLVVDNGAVWVWAYDNAIIRVDIATGRVDTPIPVGTALISGIAGGGGYIWLSHAAEGTVNRLDTKTGQVVGEPVMVGAKPIGMAYGDRLLYVVNTGDRTVSSLDGVTGQVVGRPLPVAQASGGIVVEGGVIFLGTADSVTPVDEKSFVIGNPIPLKGASLFAAGGDSVWVGYPVENVIRQLDVRTTMPRGAPIVGVGRGAADILVTDDHMMWVTNSTENTVVRVRLAQ